MQNGSPAEPPARRGKGKRKSGGSAEKRVNGDAMDIDPANTNAAGANEGTAVEAESPLPAIDEMPPISTLEIGESKGTITEKPRDLTGSTAFVGLEPGVILEQVTWSPHNRNALITAGKNHMRVFKVGANDVPENNIYTRATTVAVPSESGDYEVQAFCWTEKGSGAFTTLEKIKNENGDEMMQYKMMGFTDYGQKVNLVDPNAGWVLALKYNPDSEMILSLSWGEQAHIKIWSYSETIYENSKRRVEPKYELKWLRTMTSMLYAVEWTTPNRFLVCGQNTVDLYEVNDDIQLLKSLSTEHDWVRMEFDPVYELAAIHDANMQTLGIVTLEGDELKMRTQTVNYKITDLAFQPLPSKPVTEETSANGTAKEHQRILAVASDMGQVYLYDVSASSGVSQVQKLEMGFDAIAQCLAFSHDGFLLAAAGYDTLNVWKALEGGAQPKCVWHIPHGTDDRWKSQDNGEGDAAIGSVVNGTEGGEQSGVEDDADRFVHKLGWDADGKRIAFGMNGQVAVIRL